MNVKLAFLLFYRRMFVLKLCNWCPITNLRISAYRSMGVKIGRGVYVGFNTELDTNSPELIEIGDDVTISHHCTITTHMASPAKGPLSSVFNSIKKPVEIKRGAWICINSTILPGVTVGEDAVVSAGAVVSKDVAPRTMVGGVPARKIRDINELEAHDVENIAPE